MITDRQLSILRDIFNGCDDDWLMLHIDLVSIERNNLTVVFDKVDYQDLEELK